MHLTDRAANLEIVRRALQEAAPKVKPQHKRSERMKGVYTGLVVLLAALTGVTVTLVVIDMHRPMTAERAIQLNALARVASDLRHVPAKVVLRELRDGQGIGGSQELDNRQAGLLIHDAIRMIDAYDEDGN